MEARELNIGDVVQLSPETTGNPMFAGCMLTVTEPRSWGVQGLGEDGRPGGQAYYRVQWADMEFVGTAPWVVP